MFDLCRSRNIAFVLKPALNHFPNSIIRLRHLMRLSSSNSLCPSRNKRTLVINWLTRAKNTIEQYCRSSIFQLNLQTSSLVTYRVSTPNLFDWYPYSNTISKCNHRALHFHLLESLCSDSTKDLSSSNGTLPYLRSTHFVQHPKHLAVSKFA